VGYVTIPQRVVIVNFQTKNICFDEAGGEF